MHFAKAEPEARLLRKQAGAWLKELRSNAGLSQVELAERLGLKYYTFISQVENGFGRVPTDAMEGWAQALDVPPPEFARKLLSSYDPELYRLLFEVIEYVERDAAGRVVRKSPERLTYYIADPTPFAAAAGLTVLQPPVRLGDVGEIWTFRKG